MNKQSLEYLLEALTSENGYYALRYLRKNWDGDGDGPWIDDSDQGLLVECVKRCLALEEDT